MSNKDFEKALKNIEDCLESMKEFVKDSEKIKADMSKEITLQWYEDLDRIFTSCVDNFYAAYDPTFYRREGSLYKTYRLTNNNKSVKWEFGHKYMPLAYAHKHRVGNEYIYNQMFLQGYHGGAHTIAEDKVAQWGEHPSDGTPWYRTPPPTSYIEVPYYRWSDKFENSKGGKSAEQSTSPAQMIDDELDKYENDKANISGNTISDAINNAWFLISGRYKFFN